MSSLRGERRLNNELVVLASGLAVVGTATACWLCRRQRLRNERQFEYGPLEIQMMTDEAAKSLRGQTKTLDAVRTSLIPDALEDLEEAAAMAAESLPPSDEVNRRAEALAAVGAPPFRKFLQQAGIESFDRKKCTTLQLNIGLYCNQACTHCHVESSPLRKEMMSDKVVERCLMLLRNSPDVDTLDITGGAPDPQLLDADHLDMLTRSFDGMLRASREELNSGFRRLVEGAAELRDCARPNLRIIDRCNLTVLLEPGQENLVDFLADKKVDIVASLPSYDAAQTDKQRGRKVFQRSVEALKILNSRGYGVEDCKTSPGKRLDLVFNPPGPFLPPKQELLQAKYHKQLGEQMGITFNQLITLANMPVKRFFDFLRKKGTLEGYLDLLVRNFNAETVPQVMCTNTVNVGWDGKIYDCDFNQQLELRIGRGGGLDVFSIDSLDDPQLRQAPIRTAAHCFGCTAAQGSSCQGALR